MLNDLLVAFVEYTSLFLAEKVELLLQQVGGKNENKNKKVIDIVFYVGCWFVLSICSDRLVGNLDQ